MTKDQLLSLERNAHLSIRELQRREPALARSLQERLEPGLRRQALERVDSPAVRRVLETIELPLGDAAERETLREVTLRALREGVRREPRLAGDEELRKQIDA